MYLSAPFFKSKYEETANDNSTTEARIRKNPRLRNRVPKSTLSFAAFTDSACQIGKHESGQ